MFPTENVQPQNQDPRKMCILSQPKVGKTELLSKLPNCLNIDLENSADFYGGMYIKIHDVKRNLESEHKKEFTLLQAYLYTIKNLKEAIQTKKVSYDYIAIDTTSALEELAKDFGLIKYRNTPMGKSFKGTDIYTLAQGGGYGWVRSAFKELYEMLSGCYNKGLILMSHSKPGSIVKDGAELSVQDINLTGKLKLLVTSDMDAVGFLHRNKEGDKNLLSFKTNERTAAIGSRCKHLQNTELIISEMKDGELLTHWEKVYQTLK